jgi:hypothetical protein
MQCPVSTDPACVGQAAVGVQIPLGKAPEHSILGECEMILPAGQGKKVEPCSHVKLVLKGMKNGEEQAVELVGPHFEFKNLSDQDYRLRASSDRYRIITDSHSLRPGQTVKIRVEAKP